MSVQDRIFCQMSVCVKPKILVFRAFWIMGLYQKGKVNRSVLPLFFSGHPRPPEPALMVGHLGASDVGQGKSLYAPHFHLPPLPTGDSFCIF